MKSPKQYWKEKSTFDKVFAAAASALAIVALVLDPLSLLAEFVYKEKTDDE